MGCIKRLTEELEGLGFSPLPLYLKKYVATVCQGDSTVQSLASNYFKNWKNEIDTLREKYDISETEEAEIFATLLKNGHGTKWRDKIGSLRPLASAHPATPLDLFAKREEKHGPQFDEIIKQAIAMHAENYKANPLPPEILDEWRIQFIKRQITTKTLRDRMALKYGGPAPR